MDRPLLRGIKWTSSSFGSSLYREAIEVDEGPTPSPSKCDPPRIVTFREPEILTVDKVDDNDEGVIECTPFDKMAMTGSCRDIQPEVLNLIGYDGDEFLPDTPPGTPPEYQCYNAMPLLMLNDKNATKDASSTSQLPLSLLLDELEMMDFQDSPPATKRTKIATASTEDVADFKTRSLCQFLPVENNSLDNNSTSKSKENAEEYKRKRPQSQSTSPTAKTRLVKMTITAPFGMIAHRIRPIPSEAVISSETPDPDSSIDIKNIPLPHEVVVNKQFSKVLAEQENGKASCSAAPIACEARADPLDYAEKKEVEEMVREKKDDEYEEEEVMDRPSYIIIKQEPGLINLREKGQENATLNPEAVQKSSSPLIKKELEKELKEEENSRNKQIQLKTYTDHPPFLSAVTKKTPISSTSLTAREVRTEAAVALTDATRALVTEVLSSSASSVKTTLAGPPTSAAEIAPAIISTSTALSYKAPAFPLVAAEVSRRAYTLATAAEIARTAALAERATNILLDRICNNPKSKKANSIAGDNAYAKMNSPMPYGGYHHHMNNGYPGMRPPQYGPGYYPPPPPPPHSIHGSGHHQPPHQSNRQMPPLGPPIHGGYGVPPLGFGPNLQRREPPPSYSSRMGGPSSSHHSTPAQYPPHRMDRYYQVYDARQVQQHNYEESIKSVEDSPHPPKREGLRRMDSYGTVVDTPPIEKRRIDISPPPYKSSRSGAHKTDPDAVWNRERYEEKWRTKKENRTTWAEDDRLDDIEEKYYRDKNRIAAQYNKYSTRKLEYDETPSSRSPPPIDRVERLRTGAERLDRFAERRSRNKSRERRVSLEPIEELERKTSRKQTLPTLPDRPLFFPDMRICLCNRGVALVACGACGNRFIGNVRRTCTVHPRVRSRSHEEHCRDRDCRSKSLVEYVM